ncbi:putative glutathione dehydrogenase (ascorbate) [Helianthus anomalus]
MLNVAGSVALSCGKLPKSSFRAFKYPSFTVPFAYKSFLIVASGLRFLEVNPDGKVPLAKFYENWISDCDAIVGLIEDKYPDPSLATSPELASVYAMSLYICHMTIGMSQ